jgi:protoporphyrinogen oxidase
MSGIGAVLALQEAGKDWLAAEAQPEPGGWSQSRTVAGYRLDYGPHIMLDFDDDLLRWLALEPEISFRQHHSKSVFFCDIDGHPQAVDLPLAANIAGLPPVGQGDLPDTSRPSYARYLIDSFGPDVAVRFLIPYDTKRLCVDLETLPPKWNPRVLPAGKAKTGESSYLYPVGKGVGALSAHLLDRVDQDRLRYRLKLVRLSLSSKRAWFDDGSSVGFASLHASLPLPELLMLLDEQPFAPQQIRLALPYASSDLAYLAVRETWAQDFDFARFASDTVAFHRLTVLSAFSDHSCPAGETLLTLETNRAPGGNAPPVADPRAMIRQLVDLGMFSPDVRLAFSDTAHVRHSAIFMNAETPEFLSRATDLLAAADVHLIGKFGRWEDMLMGQALKSGAQAVRRLSQDGAQGREAAF